MNIRKNSWIEAEYQHFWETLPKHQAVTPAFTVLGEVSSNPWFYFQETNQANAYAKTFLTAYWSNPLNVKLCEDTFEQKCQRFPDAEQMRSSTISFVSVKILGKNYCLVTVSDNIHQLENGIQTSLANLIESYNRQQQNVEYVYIKTATASLNELIAQFTQQPVNTKTCTEKTDVVVLLGLFLRFGNEMRITGGVNCLLYPVDNQLQGNHRKFSPSLNSGTDYLAISENINAITISCCRECTNNKAASLHFLSHAHQVGERQRLENQTEAPLCLGKLKFYFVTATSLQDPFEKHYSKASTNSSILPIPRKPHTDEDGFKLQTKTRRKPHNKIDPVLPPAKIEPSSPIVLSLPSSEASLQHSHLKTSQAPVVLFQKKSTKKQKPRNLPKQPAVDTNRQASPNNVTWCQLFTATAIGVSVGIASYTMANIGQKY
jgi:hypothetical protein